MNATRAAFRRIAANHSDRTVQHVVVAYRIGEGVVIEPCVTFTDGVYLNATLTDEAILHDLLPFDFAFHRIVELLDDDTEPFYELVEAKIPGIMQAVFDTLTGEDFGLGLAKGYSKTLKEF